MLREKLGQEPVLVPAGPGVFEVSVDAVVVARRSRAGFPTEEEIVSAVAKAMGK